MWLLPPSPPSLPRVPLLLLPVDPSSTPLGHLVMVHLLPLVTTLPLIIPLLIPLHITLLLLWTIKGLGGVTPPMKVIALGVEELVM